MLEGRENVLYIIDQLHPGFRPLANKKDTLLVTDECVVQRIGQRMTETANRRRRRRINESGSLPFFKDTNNFRNLILWTRGLLIANILRTIRVKINIVGGLQIASTCASDRP